MGRRSLRPSFLNYEELRRKALSGDILFLTYDKNNYLSRLTSFTTNSQFTHAAFLFWFKDRLMVCESTTHGGIRIVNASVYSNREIELIEAPVPWYRIENHALEKIGTQDYGWTSATYIGIRDVLHRYLGVKLPPNDSNRNLACSEFVATVLGLQDTDIPPSKLYEILKKDK